MQFIHQFSNRKRIPNEKSENPNSQEIKFNNVVRGEKTIEPSNQKISRGQFESLTKGIERLTDTLDETEISDTRISILGPDKIENLAVCQCTEPNQNVNNYPKAYDRRSGTIDDPKMGTLLIDELCDTCHQNSITCPGHIGYIKLAHPIINPVFRKVLIYIMNIFCHQCHKPLFCSEDGKVKDFFPSLASLGTMGRLHYLNEKFTKSKSNKKDVKPHPTHIKNSEYVSTLRGPKKSKVLTTEGEIAKYVSMWKISLNN